MFIRSYKYYLAYFKNYVYIYKVADFPNFQVKLGIISKIIIYHFSAFALSSNEKNIYRLSDTKVNSTT